MQTRHDVGKECRVEQSITIINVYQAEDSGEETIQLRLQEASRKNSLSFQQVICTKAIRAACVLYEVPSVLLVFAKNCCATVQPLLQRSTVTGNSHAHSDERINISILSNVYNTRTPVYFHVHNERLEGWGKDIFEDQKWIWTKRKTPRHMRIFHIWNGLLAHASSERLLAQSGQAIMVSSCPI